MAGAVPPPGTYFVNYLEYYSAGTLTNSKGHTAISDFDLRVTADVLRFIHITDKKILGGYWGMHVLIPLISEDVSVMGMDESKCGLGDIVVTPFFLSWHSKNWHTVAGCDVVTPTGAYNKNDHLNIGRNYWTFEPVFGVTYVSDKGLDVSAKMMYDINTENDAMKYQSGDEFHVDYTIAQKIKNFSYGLGGYYYIQTTNDEQNGEKYKDGNRGEVFAAGPEIKFDSGKTSFILKYQKEIYSENRPRGDNFWFKVVHAF